MPKGKFKVGRCELCRRSRIHKVYHRSPRPTAKCISCGTTRTASAASKRRGFGFHGDMGVAIKGGSLTPQFS